MSSPTSGSDSDYIGRYQWPPIREDIQAIRDGANWLVDLPGRAAGVVGHKIGQGAVEGAKEGIFGPPSGTESSLTDFASSFFKALSEQGTTKAKAALFKYAFSKEVKWYDISEEKKQFLENKIKELSAPNLSVENEQKIVGAIQAELNQLHINIGSINWWNPDPISKAMLDGGMIHPPRQAVQNAISHLERIVKECSIPAHIPRNPTAQSQDSNPVPTQSQKPTVAQVKETAQCVNELCKKAVHLATMKAIDDFLGIVQTDNVYKECLKEESDKQIR